MVKVLGGAVVRGYNEYCRGFVGSWSRLASSQDVDDDDD